MLDLLIHILVVDIKIVFLIKLFCSAELLIICFILVGQQERKKEVECKSVSDYLLSRKTLLYLFYT